MYCDACRMGEKGLLKSVGEAGQVKPRAHEDEDEVAAGGADYPISVLGFKLEVEEDGDKIYLVLWNRRR